MRMEIIHDIADMKSRSAAIRAEGKKIGFVPTMGCLHEGHLSLVKRSLATCDFTVASIFVNPTQFGENEDFNIYPQDFEGDRKKLEDAGVNVLYLPSRKTIYPEGYKTFVEVETITDYLCGKSRPGFLRGVATIVLKLFNIVRPDKAFFGAKDWQQSVIVETMIRDLNLDVELIRVPTVREPDQLAMSSRNRYLSDGERQSALSLSRALEQARTRIDAGETSAQKIRQQIRENIEGEQGTRVDYISICDPASFVERDEISARTLIALAVHIGKARLIDNCIVEK